MNIQKLFSKISLAAIGFTVLILSGCVKQEASKVETAEKISVETSADPEMAKAQKLIEEMADSPVGYNRLATV
jgi:PBP1b-binding outer membrane lipoprotein LpoB